MQTVAHSPDRLREWEAMPETWRGPQADPIPVDSLPGFAQRLHRLRLGLAALADGEQITPSIQNDMIIPSGQLKLYQPAHQRYYLITACLVCRLSGLPDRIFDNNMGEQATYVIRRLIPQQDDPEPDANNLHQFDEYAFVQKPTQNEWQKLGTTGSAITQTFALGEEQLPLFGITYQESGAFSRRLLSGVIPVAKREAYIGAAIHQKAADGADDVPDPRFSLFQSTIAQPWRSLKDQWNQVKAKYSTNREQIEDEVAEELEAQGESTDAEEIENIAKIIKENNKNVQTQTRDSIQMSSWVILLEFANYLEKYLSDIWAVVVGKNPQSSLPIGSANHTLWQTLNLSRFIDDSENITLAAALAAIASKENRRRLESSTRTYAENSGSAFWPGFRFRLTAVSSLITQPSSPNAQTPSGDSLLETQVKNALKATKKPPNTPPLPFAVAQSAVDMSAPGWYIIRCVFERPNCIEDDPIVMSEPTRPFQLASFFDPDAPARPIRISLPTDTSPTGLSKFNKNTAFVVSDILACQMERVGDLTLGDLVRSVLPWPLHKSLPEPKEGSCAEGGGVSFGLICSLSIPIITICALILLMIIVTLLDQIFRWLPYFIACFPLPSLKGKN